MSQWQLKENRVAMKLLAQAEGLGGSYGARATKALEALFRAATGGSLDGLDRIRQAAMAELK